MGQVDIRRQTDERHAIPKPVRLLELEVEHVAEEALGKRGST
jgi:hypothetical protein